jgi:hypothetical protein
MAGVSAARVASRYASSLRLQPDYGSGDAAVPRGDDEERFRSDAETRRATTWEHRMASNPFDGLKKRKVLDVLNKILSRHTVGQFRDNGWAPITAIRADLDKENISYAPLQGSGTYEQDPHTGRDVRKVWRYKVEFVNQNQRPDAVYISITASGSGPVDDPLQVYDVVAYAS